MATVAENLQTLINIKKGIKDAINDKGGTVTDSTPYAEYATEIENLPSGGEDIWKGLIDKSISGDIKIPNDITSIGSYLFQNCSGLTSVNTSNVTSIESNAFQYCKGLSSVVMPKVTTINTYAFSGCGLLTSVNMPNALIISGYTFQNCSGLTSVDMPNVTNIYSYAFQNCSALTSIYLYNVKSIGSNGFVNCKKLENIYMHGLPASLTYSGTSASFKDVRSGGTLHVPSGFIDLYNSRNWMSTESYGLGAQNWTMVDDLPEYVPQNVLRLTYQVSSTSSATKIFNDSISANTQASLYNDNYNFTIATGFTFSNTGLQTLEFVNTTQWADGRSEALAKFYNISILKKVVIPNNFDKIPNFSFYGSGLNSIDLSNVTDIGYCAFQNCSGLISIDLSNITNIGNKAFYNCQNLQSVNMIDVKSIGSEAFILSTKLTSVTINNPIPPTLASTSIFMATVKIYVPDEAVDIYKTATNWTNFATMIYPLSQKP